MTNKSTLQIIKEDKNFILLLTLYIFLLLFFCSKMSPFYVTNEWSDPNVYFNVAKGMVNGRTLYTEVFDHKGPFIFFLYSAGYIISNSNFFGMFIIELISWLLMSYSIYLTARLYLGKAGSFFTALIFPSFLLKLMIAGGSAEEFILVGEIISLYLFVRYFKDKGNFSHNPWCMFVHGIICSMVILTKINLIMFWFFPLLGIFINLLSNKRYKNIIYNLLAYLAGFALVAIPIILYFYVNNALEEAYNTYIVLNSKYAKVGSLTEVLILLVTKILYLFLDSFSLFLLPIIGIFIFPVNFIKNTIGRWSIILSGITLYVIIFMSKTFFYYYPIPFLVFDVLGLVCIFIYIKKYASIKFTSGMIASFFFIFFFMCLSQKRLTNTWLEYKILNSKDFKVDGFMTERLSDEIKKSPHPTLLNLGFGLGNSLFTTCNIVPNVKFFLKPNLPFSTFPELRNDQTEYIRQKKTEFIVLPCRIYNLSKIKENDPNNTDEFLYYYHLPVLKENYNLIKTDTIKNDIDNNALEVYYLYKRK